jgi:hypothetical protein
MVSIAFDVLAGDVEQGHLLGLGERFRREASAGVIGHMAGSFVDMFTK